MTPQTKIEILRTGVSLLVIGYAAYCVARGQIAARMLGSRARPVLRSEEPVLFWFVIGCHAVVALAVMFAAAVPL